jgi:hypothetical protein
MEFACKAGSEAKQAAFVGSGIVEAAIAIGRAPMALIFELVRQRRRGLHVISLPNPLPAEIPGAADRVECLLPPWDSCRPPRPGRWPSSSIQHRNASLLPTARGELRQRV